MIIELIEREKFSRTTRRESCLTKKFVMLNQSYCVNEGKLELETLNNTEIKNWPQKVACMQISSHRTRTHSRYVTYIMVNVLCSYVFFCNNHLTVRITNILFKMIQITILLYRQLPFISTLMMKTFKTHIIQFNLY